jgi:hypothetical protein
LSFKEFTSFLINKRWMSHESEIISGRNDFSLITDLLCSIFVILYRDCCRDCMVVVEFTTTYASRVWILFMARCIQYKHLSVTFWFSLGAPVSSTNKTDLYDITKILLKVALKIITLIAAILTHSMNHMKELFVFINTFCT